MIFVDAGLCENPVRASRASARTGYGGSRLGILTVSHSLVAGKKKKGFACLPFCQPFIWKSDNSGENFAGPLGEFFGVTICIDS